MSLTLVRLLNMGGANTTSHTMLYHLLLIVIPWCAISRILMDKASLQHWVVSSVSLLKPEAEVEILVQWCAGPAPKGAQEREGCWENTSPKAWIYWRVDSAQLWGPWSSLPQSWSHVEASLSSLAAAAHNFPLDFQEPLCLEEPTALFVGSQHSEWQKNGHDK